MGDLESAYYKQWREELVSEVRELLWQKGQALSDLYDGLNSQVTSGEQAEAALRASEDRFEEDYE